MNRLIMVLATGFYVGRMPKAPGTWGSIAALLPWMLIKDLTLTSYFLLLGAMFIVGFFVAGSAEKIVDCPDARCIVIDEFVGIFITLAAAPDHPVAWIVGLIYFRIFDIGKPFPVSWFDRRIHGGAGIMMDDVIAGIYAWISLQLTWAATGRFL